MSYTPPPYDETNEGKPAPIPAANAGVIHTSFPLLYNHNNGMFQIGNASFDDSPEGLRRMAQFVKHYTPLPNHIPERKAPLPTDRPPHIISQYMPRMPAKRPPVSREHARALLDDISADDVLDFLQTAAPTKPDPQP